MTFKIKRDAKRKETRGNTSRLSRFSGLVETRIAIKMTRACNITFLLVLFYPLTDLSQQRHSAKTSSPVQTEAATAPATPTAPGRGEVDVQKMPPISIQRDVWDEALVVGTYGLVVFAALGLVATVITLRHISRQTSSLERQNRIQAAGMMQWAVVEARAIDFPEGQQLNLRFAVLNDTAYPFTITRIVTTTDIDQCDPSPTFEAREMVILPPGRSRDYPFYVPINVNVPGIADAYLSSNLSIITNGKIYFTDCLDQPREQWFGQIIECGRNRFDVLSPIGIQPDPHDTPAERRT